MSCRPVRHERGGFVGHGGELVGVDVGLLEGQLRPSFCSRRLLAQRCRGPPAWRARLGHHRPPGRQPGFSRFEDAGLSPYVRRDKAPFHSGCESRPATVAPAGRSRSGRWRQRHRLYAEFWIMRSRLGGPRPRRVFGWIGTPHNQSASRKSRSRSVAVKRSGSGAGSATRRSAASFMARSASTY